MKASFFDPHLIRVGVFVLIVVGRFVATANRKRRSQNRAIQPPQSTPLPPPMGSSSLPPQQLPMNSPRSQSKPQAPDSPWSDLK